MIMIQKAILEMRFHEDQIPEDISLKFLNLIFDETEEDQERIPLENFSNKYKNLLDLLSEKDCEDVDEEEVSKKNEINNDNLESFQKDIQNMENEQMQFDLKIGISGEKDQSEIILKEKSIVNPNENSLDPIDLFSDLNFNDLQFVKNDYYRGKGSSIVRPTNTFKFDMDFKYQINLEERYNKHKNNHNFFDLEISPEQSPKKQLSSEGNKQTIENENNIADDKENVQNQVIDIDSNQNNHLPTANNNNAPILSQPMINYQHNININVNNYGQLNMNPLSNSQNFMKSSNINQKLQEVYFELNKPLEKYKNKKETNPSVNVASKLDDLLRKDSMFKKDDYFVDFCKSINNAGSRNSSLKYISDKVIKMNKITKDSTTPKITKGGFGQGTLDLIGSKGKIGVSNTHTINKNYANNNYKFQDLEKLLKTSNIDTNTNLFSNNFDNLEDQLNSLKINRKGQLSTKNKIFDFNRLWSNKNSQAFINTNTGISSGITNTAVKSHNYMEKNNTNTYLNENRELKTDNLQAINIPDQEHLETETQNVNNSAIKEQ